MRKIICGVITTLTLSLFFAVRLSLANPPDLAGTSWVLSSIAGRTLQLGVTATAHFEDGRIQGTDGCNRYTMPYQASGPKLKIGPRGASTLMACPPEVNQQAEAFTANLAKAKSYR